MTSPNDNIKLKNGRMQDYALRSRDKSAGQDGTVQTAWHLSTPYPVDYETGGCFQLPSKSGTMAAGLAAGSPIYSFRWTNATALALVRRIRFQAWSLTGFTAGFGTFELFRCTGWSGADSGGGTDTITGNNLRLRSSMASSLLPEVRHATTGTLTAGTRTKDANPFETRTLNISNAANTLFTGVIDPLKLFEKLGAEHPLALAQNEGFTLQATVPAVGTWSFVVTPEWDEVPLLNYP